MAEKANKLLFTRYAKKLAELNQNVFPAALNDAGELEVPTIEIAGGGGALLAPTSDDPLKLPPPAAVSVKLRAQKPTTALYRLFVPASEVEAALNQPAYFNYFFDQVLTIALSRYAHTFGKPTEGRFGLSYVSFQEGLTHSVNEQTGEDGFLLVLKGVWVGPAQAK
jgi:hypothetical protein